VKSVEARYMNDAEFHALVDMMVKMIFDYQYTPSEMREAAMFACVKAEMIRPPESMVALRSTTPNTTKATIAVSKEQAINFATWWYGPEQKGKNTAEGFDIWWAQQH